MTAATRWSTRRLLVGVVVWVLALSIGVLGAPAARADTNVDFLGHGFGHGRGMGQWGAYGYATVSGLQWNYQQILDHFYGGTSLSTDGSSTITVRLLAQDSRDLIVYAPSGGLTIAGYAMPNFAALIRRTDTNTYQVYLASSCDNPSWGLYNPSITGPLVVSETAGTGYNQLLQLCANGSHRSYRGNLVAVDDSGTAATINDVGLDDYLRGVVPRESPASWGNDAGGKGMEALRAQAVAARSYALAENRWPFAKTCDTTACQVYGGAMLDGTVLEASTTDAAVAQTSTQVRRFSNGAIARTEFSSSTGGWSAGGTFPAVVDDGDAVAANPNHTWHRTFTMSDLSARLGVGTVTGMAVTQRNGLGDEGGRALQVTVSTTGGNVTLTGVDVQVRLGLPSNWFTPTNVPPPDVGGGPGGGWTLDANGGLTSFGGAPAAAVSGVAAGSARAVVAGGPFRRAGAVLTGDGALHPFGGGPSGAGAAMWVADIARDLVMQQNGVGGYTIDLFGGIHPYGGAPAEFGNLYDTTGDFARRLVLRSDGVSGYYVFADGRLGTFGSAPALRSSIPLPAGHQAVGLILEPDEASVAVIDDGGGITRSDGAVLRGTGTAGSITSAAGRLDGSGYESASGGGPVAVLGAPALGGGAPARDLTLVPESAGYTLDLYGGVHPYGGAPALVGGGYWPGWDIARAVAIGSDGNGVTLDGFGGVHPLSPVGTIPPAPPGGAAYWPGFDIARDVVLLPGRSNAGYVLDGWGGIHPFGGAPDVRGGAYWPGWDIARAIALLPDGSGGYELDGWGGIHPFAVGGAPMPATVATPAYWPGWDIARGIVAYGNGAGAVLDGIGGIQSFGVAVTGSYYNGSADVARGLSSDWNSGWTTYTDVGGSIHTVGPTASANASAVWAGNVVRDNALRPAPRSG